MKAEKSHKWKEGASWHCSMCQNPILFGKPQIGICALCADQAEDCKEWADAIAAKNGK